jgi:translation initiation factor 4G
MLIFQTYDLNDTFAKLKALTSKDMKNKIPSRIKFMIQDVIDLRRDKWVPRRNDSKPKLINEIANDAKNEAMEQSVALSSYNRQDKREHHRGDDNKFRGGDNKSRRK